MADKAAKRLNYPDAQALSDGILTSSIDKSTDNNNRRV